MTDYSIGKKLFKEKKYKEAAGYFKSYISSICEVEEIDASEWYTMALCFDKAGLYEDAMDAYLNLSHCVFMEIPDPNDGIHVECLAYLIKHKYSHKYPDMVGIIENLYMDEQMYHSYYFYAMSAWFFRLNKIKKSLEFLKKGIEYNASACKILFKFNPEMKNSKKVMELLKNNS